MISIPLFALVFVYLFFLLGFCIFSIINIGHLVNTGTFTFASSVVTFLYVTFSITVILLTWSQVAGINWDQPLIIWNIAWVEPIYTLGSAL